MKDCYAAVVKKDGDWWTGWIEKVPDVNRQERSQEEPLETLKVTLREALELDKQDGSATAGTELQEEL